MTVAEAQLRVSSREFTDWQAFAELEPFGEERADLRAGIIASTLANVNRGRGTRAFKPSDFMPKFDAPRIMSADEIGSRLMAFAEQHNRSVKG